MYKQQEVNMTSNNWSEKTMFNIIDKIKLKVIGGWGGIQKIYNENKKLKERNLELRGALFWSPFFKDKYKTDYQKYLEESNKEYEKERDNYRKNIRNMIFYTNLQTIYGRIFDDATWDYYHIRESRLEDKVKDLENKLKDTARLESQIIELESKLQNTNQLNDEITELKQKLRKLKNKKENKQFKMVTRGSKEYLWFRDAVLRRDKVCQCCGGHHDLEVHHILSFKSYNHLGADTNNGIVLCERCHKKYHSKYGRDGRFNNAATLAVFLRDYGKTLQSKLVDPIKYFDEDKLVISYGK